MKKLEIIWSKKAKGQLNSIYNYYKDQRQTPRGATNIKNDILKAVRGIVFEGQYQKDSIQPEYRRVIVRDYKILYKEKDGEIHILRLFSTRRDPKKQIENE